MGCRWINRWCCMRPSSYGENIRKWSCSAVAALRTAGHRVTLFMVGSGEMDHELRDLAAACDERSIVFAGFINQRDLPQVYAACDIFVLPAENEPWGLVVNEVMCAGLPVVFRLN